MKFYWEINSDFFNKFLLGEFEKMLFLCLWIYFFENQC